jgi:hypothetical protein
MGVMDQIRRLSMEQRAALRALDDEERTLLEMEELEAEHVAAEDVYLRRRDRLLGRAVRESYPEIESARALLEKQASERQKRFERMRMAILAGHVPRGATSQLDLLSAAAAPWA